jgi:sarcosine oxidase, subunit beta
MTKNAKIVIIGAGISGSAIAYNLAVKGVTNILVLDKGYLTNGATGRCGAGVRQQWGTEANCMMAKKSIEFFEHAQQILAYDGDIEFKQEGYLILATTTKEEQDFDANVKLQQQLGIPSRRVTREEALSIVPHLNPQAFLSATYCPTDGHLNPFKMTDAYYQAAKRLGVTFHFYEEVQGIDLVNGKIHSVRTDKAVYPADVVVDAAGGYSQEIGRMVGIEIPVYSENHEILVTEPIDRMQGPMVMSFSKNIYCQQVPHGAFLMGRSNPFVEHNHEVSSTHQFLDEMAKTVCEILPAIGELRVIRQWGGSYNMSPDRQPIVCGSDQVPGFYMACGFSGHGFMFAPMTGLLLSELILGEPTTLDVAGLDLKRFANLTTTVIEKSVV